MRTLTLLLFAIAIIGTNGKFNIGTNNGNPGTNGNTNNGNSGTNGNTGTNGLTCYHGDKNKEVSEVTYKEFYKKILLVSANYPVKKENQNDDSKIPCQVCITVETLKVTVPLCGIEGKTCSIFEKPDYDCKLCEENLCNDKYFAAKESKKPIRCYHKDEKMKADDISVEDFFQALKWVGRKVDSFKGFQKVMNKMLKYPNERIKCERCATLETKKGKIISLCIPKILTRKGSTEIEHRTYTHNICKMPTPKVDCCDQDECNKPLKCYENTLGTINAKQVRTSTVKQFNERLSKFFPNIPAYLTKNIPKQIVMFSCKSCAIIETSETPMQTCFFKDKHSPECQKKGIKCCDCDDEEPCNKKTLECYQGKGKYPITAVAKKDFVDTLSQFSVEEMNYTRMSEKDVLEKLPCDHCLSIQTERGTLPLCGFKNETRLCDVNENMVTGKVTCCTWDRCNNVAYKLNSADKLSNTAVVNIFTLIVTTISVFP